MKIHTYALGGETKRRLRRVGENEASVSRVSFGVSKDTTKDTLVLRLPGAPPRALPLPAMEAAPNEIAVLWNGVPVKVLMSSKNETGYHNIHHQKDAKRSKPFYAKFDPGDGSKQKTLNGSSSATAEEAACKLAYFMAGHDAILPPKEPRMPRKSSEVCSPCLRCPRLA